MAKIKLGPKNKQRVIDFSLGLVLYYPTRGLKRGGKGKKVTLWL